MLSTLLGSSAAVATPAQPPFAESSADHLAIARNDWVRRCTVRLRELRPAEDHRRVALLVEEMWRDEPHFNPELAAEIEHESWFTGH